MCVGGIISFLWSVAKGFMLLILILVLFTACVALLPESDDDSNDSSEEMVDDVESNVDSESNMNNDVPTEWSNALAQADTYANDMNMSYQGVYDQLTSEHGGQFGGDAAQYAVDNVNTNWFENALQAGETYYYDMNMSKQAVYDQLISEHGNQFTVEQAQYAYDHLN